MAREEDKFSEPQLLSRQYYRKRSMFSTSGRAELNRVSDPNI
jgi:hypothetical protein